MSNGDSKKCLDEQSFATWREFLGSSYSRSLALVCMAVWLHAANSLSVTTMLPSIVSEIGGTALVGWSITLYQLGSIVAGAASALLTLRYGLRIPMGLAAILFGVGCVISAISVNMPMVLLGRSLQGLGGGGLVAMGFVAIGALFPRRYMARALAVVSAIWGISAFLGPLIGGVFVEYATWRWGFGFFASQALVLSVWILLRLRQRVLIEPPRTRGFPVWRLVVLALGIIMIATSGVHIQLVRTTSLIGAGLLLLIVFLRLDGHASQSRLLPQTPLNPKHKPGAALLMILSMSIATIAINAFGPFLIMAIHNVSALTAGFIIACSSVGWMVMAILVSGSPERLDRLMISLGMLAVAFSIVGFIYSVSKGPVWLIAVFAFVEGGGFGMAWTFILRRVTAYGSAEEIQRISGALPTIQSIGYALGAAYIGIVANATGFLDISTPAEAADVAYWVFSGCLPFAIVGMLAMSILVRHR